MNAVQVEQKSYEMPPRDGFTVTHFITVADIANRLIVIKRSAAAVF